jgi:glutamine---fructose-6-phosphate transaminase (isomerizing)
MCGIVAYAGHQPVSDVLVEGLKRLEYRGYDSSGIAILGAQPYLAREVGKVEVLERKVREEKPAGETGIAHTR